MADPSIKTFTFSKDAMAGGKIKRARNTRKNNQDGGEYSLPTDTSPNIMKIGGIDNSSLATRSAPINSPSNSIIPPTYDIKPVPSTIINVQTQVPLQNTPSSHQQSQPQAQTQNGGSDSSSTSKSIKVELRKHHTHKKVHLNPKTSEEPKHIHKKEKTRKARKVTLGVKTLHKRMTRAKKLRDKVKDMPLDKLKEELIKKKLIKSTSKAPESVIRQIAIDAQIVAGKAL